MKIPSYKGKPLPLALRTEQEVKLFCSLQELDLCEMRTHSELGWTKAQFTQRVKRLRAKMLKHDPSFDSIITIYGIGYSWKEPGVLEHLDPKD